MVDRILLHQSYLCSVPHERNNEHLRVERMFILLFFSRNNENCYDLSDIRYFQCQHRQDAIGQYDLIMQGNPDHQTGFNLVLCYYALEDGLSMRKAFQRLAAIPIQARAVPSDESPLQVTYKVTGTNITQLFLGCAIRIYDCNRWKTS